MKRLITTRADDGIKEMCEVTHPYIINYAKKCDADFLVIEDSKDFHPHYRILQLYDMFDKYDSILMVDSDILITNSCPNIFEYVDDETVGTIYEDKGSRKLHRRNLIQKVQEERAEVGWTKGYVNTGFILFPKTVKEIFNLDQNKVWMDFGQDDIELGYQMHKYAFNIQELSFKFNHMTMFSEDWNNNASRFDSYVIHYAGSGLFAPCINRTELIKQDNNLLKKYNLI